ncbi:hypothetical protein P7C70_g3015, partial [Phenoliferia sp. Uapishka_3]
MLLPLAVQAVVLGSLATASPLHQRAHAHSSVSDPHAGPPLPSDYVGPLSTGGTWTAGFKKAKAIVDQMTLAELVNVTTGGGPLGRSPLGGRNWEGGSPDNYLNGVLSYIGVKGLQDAGVQASAKHYIAYEQETWRTAYSATTSNVTARDQQIDSYLDDTTMHELYLTSFAEAVRAGARTLAGLGTEMPGAGSDGDLGDFLGYKLANLSQAGGIEMARLKDMAIRSLLPYYQLGQDTNYPEVSFDAASLGDGLVSGQYVINQYINVQRDHYKVIRTIGEAQQRLRFLNYPTFSPSDLSSHSLLKNVVAGGKGLPIGNTTTRIGVFGQDATYSSGGLTGCGDFHECTTDSTSFSGPGPNGTQSCGGGSGTALAPYVYTPLEAITARGRRTGLKVDYELNENDTMAFVAVAAGNVQKASVLKSISLPRLTRLVFVAFQSEGIDRDDLQLYHNGATLINTVAAACSDVIVVIHSGGQVDMESFADHENVTAIVFAYYPGQETGAAIDSVLFGDVSPSGKLPWTVGKSIEDIPSGANSIVRDDVKAPDAHFIEGVFIDYKWFDAKNITPRYEFGFGLSYSIFEFSNATVTSNYTADCDYVQKTNEVLSGGGDLYDQIYTVGVTVKNTGDVYAAEVAQVSACDLLMPPVYIPSGEFTFSLGSSSRGLPLSVKFTY